MRANISILALFLLGLIVAGSLSLFTNPDPLIDFTSSTNHNDYLIIPANKEVVSAQFQLIPYATQSSLKSLTFSGSSCGSGSTAYYGFYITPSQDIILYEVKQTRPLYTSKMLVYDSNNNLICTLPEVSTDIFRQSCELKAGQTYIVRSDYYDNSRCVFYIQNPSDGSFNLKGYPDGSLTNIYVDYIKYYTKDNPKDLNVYVSNENIYSYTGFLQAEDTTQDFSGTLNRYCDRPSNKAECKVPVSFSTSQTGGKLKVNDTITLKDISEETSLSTAEPKYYQYRAIRHSSSNIREIRLSITDKIKEIFSSIGFFSQSSSVKHEEIPICRIIKIPGVCDQ